jgi:hypothetical protein
MTGTYMHSVGYGHRYAIQRLGCMCCSWLGSPLCVYNFPEFLRVLVADIISTYRSRMESQARRDTHQASL